MSKLWDKGYALDSLIERFEIGDDSTYDNELVEPDVLGSVAHAEMLARIGVLASDELGQLREGLAGILELYRQGEFRMSPSDEDVHTKVENWLVEHYGAVGKRIHTARSRNDQVLLDLRLYSKRKLLEVETALLSCAAELARFAQVHELVPMPGYTHMQRAMLSSVGTWAGAYAEALHDDVRLLETAYELTDQSPLGSAAAYGVPLPIDRQYVADRLGFAKVQNNVLYAQNSRGKLEAVVVQALSQVMLDLSKLAQDVLLFTTAEYGFFRVSDSLVTGSSIMPQKKNISMMELLRAKAAVMLGYQQQVMGVLTGLPSGYNKDYQETKRPFMDAVELALQSLAVVELTVRNLEPNEERLSAACTPELYATDHAYELVRQGVPFRDAYRYVGTHLDELPAVDAQQSLAQRTHAGASGNLGLERLVAAIDQEQQAAIDKLESLSSHWAQLLGR
ncbi:MAG: argininosuccinate lyase [Chloroflexota bacterium]|nr:argininosuccinate lyase [Chloroflexota bacterium]